MTTSSVDVEAIEKLIASLGLYGFDGDCGLAAIEINERVFGGEGQYVAGLNSRWLAAGRFVGHVAVLWGDHYWDALGALHENELLGYGADSPALVKLTSAEQIRVIHAAQRAVP
jgi:hypothetical protein